MEALFERKKKKLIQFSIKVLLSFPLILRLFSSVSDIFAGASRYAFPCSDFRLHQIQLANVWPHALSTSIKLMLYNRNRCILCSASQPVSLSLSIVLFDSRARHIHTSTHRTCLHGKQFNQNHIQCLQRKLFISIHQYRIVTHNLDVGNIYIFLYIVIR